ncbi:uracil-DNA glycosylase [Anaerolineales bacterium]
MSIAQLLDEISKSPSTDVFFNPYAPPFPDNAIRLHNLKRYLQQMLERQPNTLMLMEAPGYRGCRLTGIPVTSRKIMLESLPDLPIFGSEQGFTDTHDPGFEAFYNEQSATILWPAIRDVLRQKGANHLPLLWNSFPFHPHKSGQILSNRKPKVSEIQAFGLPLLEKILLLYQPKNLLAVGNVAHETFQRLGYNSHKLRHPAQGGKNDFISGLNQYL